MVRLKNRYVLAEMVFHGNAKSMRPDTKSLYGTISTAFSDAFGDYGIGLLKGSLRVRYISDNFPILLIRIRRGAERMLSNALLLITKHDQSSVKFITHHISGSVRSAEKFWIRYSRKQLDNLICQCTDPVQKAKLVQEVRTMRKKTDITKIFSDQPDTVPVIKEELLQL